MGKIRVKTFDESTAADEASVKAKKEAKMNAKNAAKTANVEVVVKKETQVTEEIKESVENPIEDKAETIEASSTPEVANEKTEQTKEKSDKTTGDSELLDKKNTKESKKTKKEKFAKTKADSKRHKENLSTVSRTQSYSIDQALEMLKKFKKLKFDETVELHINTKEKGVSGQVTLPHGTGKTLVIKIADDAILAEVAKGKINFDVLVASPSMMPSLAKVAKVLGPRGLMPNPKNGTIAEKPEEAVKKLSGGQINYKTESESPIIHARVGKLSFENKMLKENIELFITTVGNDKINSVILKSTMSPAVKLDYLSL